MALAVPESKIVYTGDGSTEAFPIPFPVDDDELVVLRRLPTAEAGTDDEELERGVDFDVEDDAETDTRSITFDTAPATGVSIAILRRLPLVQEVEFEEDGDGAVVVLQLQETVDRLTRQLQAVRDDTDRSLKVPHTTAVVPAAEKPVANSILAIDETGERITYLPVTDFGGGTVDFGAFSQAYDFNVSFPSVPPDGQGAAIVMSRMVQIPLNLSGTRAVAATAAVDEEQEFVVKVGTSEIGRIVFAIGATTGTVTGVATATDLAAGDVLSVTLDGTPDLHLSGIAITVFGRVPVEASE